MKNQYVGDIGDYGKYGLLRFLAGEGISIGINWYLTENDGSTDGRYIEYLNKEADRTNDPELFDVLKSIAFRKDKTVKMIEESGIIPGALFYSETLRSADIDVNERKLNRNMWFNNSTLFLNDAELIFADPDNGISFQKSEKTKDSEKYILPDEIVSYYNDGKNLVYYCHKGRRIMDAWDKAKVEIKKYIRDAQILAVTFHRGTQRSYIFVLHPDCFKRYERILTSFLESPWGNMFTRERIDEHGYSILKDGPARKILIVVDMQNDFIDGTLGSKEAVSIVKDVKKKIRSYPISDVIATMDTHGENYLETQEGKNLPVKHCIKGTRGWRIRSEIDPFLVGAKIYEKPTFGSISLAEDLQKLSWSEKIELEIVGLCTDICVISNALLLKAFMPEVKITVDSECCAGVTPEKHLAALETMRSCQIEVI